MTAAPVGPAPARPFAPAGDTLAPTGWARRPQVRANAADPTLEHQICIRGHSADLYVACNCLVRQATHGIGAIAAPTLGTFGTLDEACALYRAHLPAEATT